MPISDNDPERRNLMVSSLCFITFFLGGGEFLDNSIRLQVVNVKFNNGMILCVLAWLMLFWFALRYWQTHQGVLKAHLFNEIKSPSGNNRLVHYVSSQTGLRHNWQDGFSKLELVRHSNSLRIRYHLISGGSEVNGKWVNFRTTGAESLEIEGYMGRFALATVYLSAAIKKPSIGSYFVPYLLFVIAALLGLNSLLEPIKMISSACSYLVNWD